MNDLIILPKTSELYQIFEKVGREARIVFFAGLPGVGKSLLLQQFALIAHQNGRTIHTLQWDVTRSAFEDTPENQVNYPEIDGSTHPVIRKAVGIWARQGVLTWHQTHFDPAHLLVGEVPLIGNRLIELVKKEPDEVETLLAGETAVFILPVPSQAVRRVIESARNKSIANPQHEKELKDAQPNVLQAIWQDVARLGHELGFTPNKPQGLPPYDPSVYTAVYRHLLQHRHLQILPIQQQLTPKTSAYDLDIAASTLAATHEEVVQIMNRLRTTWSLSEIETQVSQWANL